MITERLELREIEEWEVTDTYINSLNDREYMAYMDIQNTWQTIQGVREYIRASRVSELERLYGVFWRRTGLHVGNIRLSNWHREYKKIELGILILKEHSSQGIGAEAVRGIVSHIFHHYDMMRISAGIYTENIASLTMFTRAGFEVEGVERYFGFLNGQFMHRYVVATYNL